MKKQIRRLYKDKNGLWYIDLEMPEIMTDMEILTEEEFKTACLLIENADVLAQSLAIASGKENEVCIEISITSFPNSFSMSLLREEEGGGRYTTKNQYFNGELWLCMVTKFILGGIMPQILFIAITDKDPDTSIDVKDLIDTLEKL